MKRSLIVAILASAVALTGTAYAEVQNVKVSGDIDMKAIVHRNYDLKEETRTINTNVVSNQDSEDFALSTVHVGVDADLTDNVSASVRLLNQRKWDGAASAPDQISIDNAYVVLKEFLYSPLTIKAGRQDLKYGTGFIVGPGLLADPNGVFASGVGQEFSAYNSYDAIRVILDYSPVTIEGLAAKINETNLTDADQDLYGAVVTYKADRWNAEIAPYWFYKQDKSAALVVPDSGRTYEENDVHTVGAWVSATPIENLNVSGEGAYQFGWLKDRAPVVGQAAVERDRSAYAANVNVNYTWAKVRWTPVTGAGWVYFSGEENDNSDTDDYSAWDGMYRGQFFTAIHDFLDGTQDANLYTTVDANDTGSAANRHLVYGDFGIKPMSDVGVNVRYAYIWNDEVAVAGRSKELGHEVDGQVTYDYTEDVQLKLIGAAFIPGAYYDEAPNSNTRSNDTAYEVIGSAAVKF